MQSLTALPLASFATAQGEYISNTFGSVYYRWKHKIEMKDLDFIINNNIDIVMMQITERSLYELLDDFFPKEK